MRKNRNAHTVLMGQLDTDLGVGGRIILKHFLEKTMVTIKRGVFDYLRNY
jgi:hypothetical protein